MDDGKEMERMREIESIVRLIEASDEKTALGEDTCWLSLASGRSIEVTEERKGMAHPFWSVRLHCSEDEFDDGKFADTLGIVAARTTDTNGYGGVEDAARYALELADETGDEIIG